LLVYAGLVFAYLTAFWALGVSLYYWAPEVFDAWRHGNPHEEITAAANVLNSFLYVIPLAFAISSLLYGMLDGLKAFAFSLLGILVGSGLVVVYFIGGLFVACYGWSNCI